MHSGNLASGNYLDGGFIYDKLFFHSVRIKKTQKA